MELTELNALVLNTKEILWLRRILDNLSLPQLKATTLYGDNTSSMLIAKEQRINKNTKHIELYFHFLQEEIQQFIKSIQLRYIDTKQNIADIFTKGIIGPKLFIELSGHLFNSVDFITKLNGAKQPNSKFISKQPTIDELKFKIWKRTDNNKLKDAIDDYNEMKRKDDDDNRDNIDDNNDEK